ncbi:hypothetical protein [Bosea sp. (in: a-proteobacteria)]|uniref:hypothetical protein n=1 Tax=Bosea sp. (in: a-proteobacteria) TaxID=1871050 RepID=UPI002FC58199
MICCSLGAIALATTLARRRRLMARLGLAFPIVLVALLLGATIGLARHAGHYAERARLNQRAVLAEVLAAPICSGAAAAVAISVPD